MYTSDLFQSTSNLNEDQEFQVLYINDKPVAKYTDPRQAKEQLTHLQGKFPTKKIELKKEMREASDPSGMMHAARHYNKSFIITAELAEGGTKKYRIHAQSERVAREKFSQHYNMAKVLSVEEEGMAEGLNEFTPDNGGEITERINQKSIQAGFKDHQKVMGGKFDLYADSDGRTLTVELHDPNADFWEKAAWARFEVKGLFFMKNLQSFKTWVEPQYRRMGLATTIYQYVQNLGNTIKPAVVRTDMGKAMWKGFKSKGVAEGTVSESLQPGQYYVATVTLDDGETRRFKVTWDEGYVEDINAFYAKQGRKVADIKMDWDIKGEIQDNTQDSKWAD